MKEITVLFVDDEPSVLNSLKRFLIREPYQQRFAKSGAAALEMMAKEPVHVIVSDMKMPEMDGLSLLKRVKENYPETIRMVLSGFSHVENIIPAINTGEIYRYINKPLEPSSFKETLYSAIDFYLLNLDRKELVNKLRVRNHALEKALNEKKLAEKSLEKARQRAMETDSRIENTLLRGKVPGHIQGASIASFSLSARHLGGDFYDIIDFSPTCLDLIIGDVMGKGSHAALIGAGTKQYFLRALGRSRCTQENGKTKTLPELSQIVQEVHDQLAQGFTELESFVTVCYARLDLEHHQLDFVDCGHLPLLHYQAKDASCHFHSGVNMPIGFTSDEKIIATSVKILPGDILMFYSDGITETGAPEGEMFGQEMLEHFVREHHALDPEALLKALQDHLENFRKSTIIQDDCTGIAVKIE